MPVNGRMPVLLPIFAFGREARDTRGSVVRTRSVRVSTFVPSVAFVTCCQLPEPDVDEGLLMDAAAKAGLSPALPAWDDPDVDWASFDLAVVRSTWNYYEDEAGFRAWIDRAGAETTLWNPASLMHRNLHKSYLTELAAAGVPTVPTRFVAKDGGEELHEILRQTGWDKFVVKPAVSAGSYRTRVYTADGVADAVAFLPQIHAATDAMIQPYVTSVDHGGEVALILIDGEFTHAVAKRPRFDTDDESVSEALQPTEEQLTLAHQVLAATPERPLYARIDLMRLDDGTLALSEAEFVEPSLFFRQHPAALERFVAAVAKLV